MHIHSRLLTVLLSGLALLGCVGEAEWSLEPPPADPAAAVGAPDARTHVSSFQGLSSGLPANAALQGIAHLDGTVYLAVGGSLFSLGAGSKAWAQVSLPLNAGEQVTSVTRVDLALYVTTSQGLLRLDWGNETPSRLTAAPPHGALLVKKGGELLLATTDGLFASSDEALTFSKRSGAAFFSRPLKGWSPRRRRSGSSPRPKSGGSSIQTTRERPGRRGWCPVR